MGRNGRGRTIAQSNRRFQPEEAVGVNAPKVAVPVEACAKVALGAWRREGDARGLAGGLAGQGAGASVIGKPDAAGGILAYGSMALGRSHPFESARSVAQHHNRPDRSYPERA